MKALARRPEDRYSGGRGSCKLDDLRLHARRRQLPDDPRPARAHVIRQGEVGDAAYIVVESGSLEVFQTRRAAQVAARARHKNDMFGETAIFARRPRTASVVVLDRRGAQGVHGVGARGAARLDDAVDAGADPDAREVVRGVEEERRARPLGPRLGGAGRPRPVSASASLRLVYRGRASP
jgi:hypothetical protein